jgi:hypothetical protein
MGRGRREENDPPMKKPTSFMDADSDGVLSSGEEEGSYCATRRELGFSVDRSSTPEVGQQITLRAGEPVEVLRNGDVIGTLGNTESPSMKSCIAMGYRMSGAIASLDAGLDRGTISISGTRLEGSA